MRSRVVVGIVALLCFESIADATPKPVLLPAAADQIKAAFDRLRPSLAWDSIQIDRDHVDAKLCPAGRPKTGCFPVRLDAPSTSAEPFRVTYPNGAPSAADLATIHSALASITLSSIWSEPPAPHSIASNDLPALKGWTAAINTVFAAMWVILFVLIAWLATVNAVSGRVWAGAITLFVFSVALRCWFTSLGPGDLKLNLAGIFDSTLDLRWGPAPIALFRLVAGVVSGFRDTHIFAVNIFLASLIPLLLSGIVEQLGVPRRAAFVAGLAAAAHPLLIVFSGVLNRQPAYLFAAFASVYALAKFLRDGGAASMAAFTIGTVLAALSRPEGAHVLVVDAAVIALLAAPAGRRLGSAAILGLLSVGAFVYVTHLATGSGTQSAGFAEVFRLRSFANTVLLNGACTPAAWIAAWIVGLIWCRRDRAAWIAAASILGIVLLWNFTGVSEQFAGYDLQVASTRYETILMLPFAIGIGLLANRVLSPGRWGFAAFVLVTAGTVATYPRPKHALLEPFTIDREYAFLRRTIPSLPSDAVVFIPESPVDDIGFIGAPSLGRFIRSSARLQGIWDAKDCANQPEGGQNFLYFGSYCADTLPSLRHPSPGEFRTWHESCDKMRATLISEPVAQEDVPARPMSWDSFREQTVRIGLYRLKGAFPCDVLPPAPEKL